jgi:hypothetical protein
LVEGKFALFLMECLKKHRSSLSPDDLFKLQEYSDRISALLTKVKESDDFLRDNSSDEEFTEPISDEVRNVQDKPPDKLPVYL